MLEASSGLISDWKKVTTSSYNDLDGSPESSGLDVDNAVKTVVGLAINIAYLGFQVLSEHLSSVARMFDGVIDSFTDEAGVETATNGVYGNYNNAIIGDNASPSVNINFYLPNKGDLDINTKLLIHGDGVQGSTSFVDLCRIPIEISGASTDTSTKKFGTGSIKFDGVNDYISLGESFSEKRLTMFDVEENANGQTIDFWFNSNASGVQPILSNGEHISDFPEEPTLGDGEGLLITKNASNKIEAVLQCGEWSEALQEPVDSPLTVESTTVISNGTWYHIAVQKTSTGYLQLWINGALEATSSASDTGAAMNSWPSVILYVGKNGSSYLNGYLDEIRWSQTARYTTTFTPMTKAYNTATTPAPTPVIEDESSSAHTVVVNSNARMSGTNPLFGNASLYLDGIDSTSL
jgi:hypothetical protein